MDLTYSLNFCHSIFRISFRVRNTKFVLVFRFEWVLLDIVGFCECGVKSTYGSMSVYFCG